MDWDKMKFGLLSATGGAIVLAVIGFNWGGWVTTGSAEAMAKEIAANAYRKAELGDHAGR
jgi:hypothetical protein